MDQYTGRQVNKVLDVVRGITDDGDMQLSIIARAFIAGCISCGVSQERAADIMAGMWKVPIELVQLPGIAN